MDISPKFTNTKSPILLKCSRAMKVTVKKKITLAIKFSFLPSEFLIKHLNIQFNRTISHVFISILRRLK